MGLSTWLFNALSHRLPSLPPNLPNEIPTYLPPPPHLAGMGMGEESSRRPVSGRPSLASPSSTRPSPPSERPSVAAAAAPATTPKARVTPPYGNTAPFTLPPEDVAPYWGHLKELLVQAAELTKRARFRAERDTQRTSGKESPLPLRTGAGDTHSLA